MSTKMDDKIESLYEKEIEAKISYEGYARWTKLYILNLQLNLSSRR